MSTIPAHCPSCGAIFKSRLISVSGNVTGLHMSGNTETCPFCGFDKAVTAEGIFNIADNVLTVISSPAITKEILEEFNSLLKASYSSCEPPDKLIEKAEKISPELSSAVKSFSLQKGYFRTGILLLIYLISKITIDINVSVDLDVNELLSQASDLSPVEVTQSDNK